MKSSASSKAESPNKPVIIAPALLCKTREEFITKISTIEKFAKRAQVDVMDGIFVPNKTVMPKQLTHVHTPVKLEVQLMVKNPEKLVEDCCKMRAWMIIFHYESVRNNKKTIDLIHAIHAHRKKAGIAINPETPASAVKPFLPLVDLALIMTVHPGFGGQKLLTSALQKVRQVREWNKNIDVEVDGGIHENNASQAVKAGANVLVAGTEIFESKNPREAFARLERAAKK